MTRDEARRRAVEAVARALRQNNLDELGLPPETWENTGTEYREYWLKRARIAIDTAERAMADAGWRMVRATPTDAMCFAGAKALDEMQAPSAVLMGIGYLAMLAEDDAGG